MKHINKNSGALIITVPSDLDLALGTGWGSLALGCTVYSIDTGLYLCHKNPETGAPIPNALSGVAGVPSQYAWTATPPSSTTPSAWPSRINSYEAYEAYMPSIGPYGAVFAPDYYWVNLNLAHQLLDANQPANIIYSPDSITVSHPNWDAGLGIMGSPGPGFAGRKGYILRIHDTAMGSMSGITMPLPPIYLHLTVDEVGSRNVNVIEWSGNSVSASAGGYPDVNVHEYHAAAVTPTIAGTPDVNVSKWNGTGATVDAGLPNVNVSDWGGSAAVLSKDAVGDLPNINVESYAGSPAQISGGLGLPNINVSEWNSSIQGSSTSGLPQVDVQEYKDAIVATSTPGIPEVNIVSVNDDFDAANGLEDFATNGYDRTASKVEVVKVVDTGGISESSFSDNAISERVINAAAITNEKFHDDAIDDRVIKDGSIKETKFDGDAISARVIATDAIDEDAIKIDSVTYEEISDSAVREIVSGIWNASVFGPIDQSVDGFGVKNYAGTNPALAEPGTMGHAMLISYLSKHLSHASGAIGSTATPMHTSKLDDPTGSKFYSKWLDATPLIDPEETKSYVDRSAIIFRGLSSDGSVDPAISQHHLVRIAGIKTDADGQYFEVHLMDEDQTLVPGGITAEVGFSLGDILIIKAETDATMHEVAHEVWEESVFDHETPDTYGMLNRIMAGLSQFNHQITDSKYDPSGRLLSCRLVVYSSSDEARAGINPLTTIEVSSTYDEKQNMSTFVSAEEK